MPTAPRGGGGVAPRATGGGVSGYLLLVTRDKTPFAEVSGDRPPRHADACHPSAEGNLDRDGTGETAPSVVKGTLGCGGNVLSSPPLEGWATPGPARCVAWVVKPGVVREYGIIHLVPQFVIPAQAGIGLGLLLVILFWE